MLQVLSPNNFTVNKLRELYQKMVLPFTDLHSIHRHTKETSMFFENKIKPMFQCMFNQYPGDNVVVKFINLIQEIRINILNSILETIEEYRYSSQIILEPYQVELIKFLIIQHKHQLAKASSSCHDCIMFRSLIDGILHANPILYNHHVFGSWRFFDPCNNKRNGLFSSGLFTYQLNKLQQTTLHVFGIDIDDEMLSQPNHFVVHVIEVIAFYYLITKETSISIFNQKQRFNTYMKIIVQVLRGHNNKDEKLFVDLPLCPGAIKEHLIKCGEQYGDSKFKFISFKDIVENAISREVYSRLNSKTESLTESMSLQEIYKLCQALSITGQNLFTCTTIMQKPQQNLQFINIEPVVVVDKKLLIMRYSLLNAYNKQGLPIYNYKHQLNIFIKNILNNIFFTTLSLNFVNTDCNVQATLLEYINCPDYFIDAYEHNQIPVCLKELALIIYAISDPAYCCYNKLVELYNMKKLSAHDGLGDLPGVNKNPQVLFVFNSTQSLKPNIPWQSYDHMNVAMLFCKWTKARWQFEHYYKEGSKVSDKLFVNLVYQVLNNIHLFKTCALIGIANSVVNYDSNFFKNSENNKLRLQLLNEILKHFYCNFALTNFTAIQFAKLSGIITTMNLSGSCDHANRLMEEIAQHICGVVDLSYLSTFSHKSLAKLAIAASKVVENFYDNRNSIILIKNISQYIMSILDENYLYFFTREDLLCLKNAISIISLSDNNCIYSMSLIEEITQHLHTTKPKLLFRF